MASQVGNIVSGQGGFHGLSTHFGPSCWCAVENDVRGLFTVFSKKLHVHLLGTTRLRRKQTGVRNLVRTVVPGLEALCFVKTHRLSFEIAEAMHGATYSFYLT
jgi:hypothetical protein